MPTGSLAPNPVLQVFDINGDPLAGAKLFTFLTGTAVPSPIYHNSALTVPWTNPAIADAGGFFASIYMAATPAQKWVLQDALGVVQWTVDPVSATANAAGAGSGLGEIFAFGSNSSSPITALAYNAGATFDKLQPGSSVFAEDSANLTGTYAIQATGVQTTAGTLSVSLMDLSSGAPDTPIATCTITSLTGQVATSGPITFGAPGVVRNYGLKCLVSANAGFLFGVALIKTA